MVQAALLSSSLDPQGPAAGSTASLWWLMLALSAAVFLLVVGLLVVALIRRGPQLPDGRAAPPSSRAWLVGGGVVLPTVVLTVVLAATVAAMADVDREAPPGSLVIEVTAHQFWWEISYPQHGVITANELHLPVGSPVAVRLHSADVIHSFWVPALAGKMDAMPDYVNTLVLEADEPGSHRTHCAEFCGLQHANMGLLVVAEPPDRFARWLGARAAPPVEPSSPLQERGREVFASAGCASCHAIGGGARTGGSSGDRFGPGPDGDETTETSVGASIGPDLTHLAARERLGGVVANEPEQLAAWIADPHALKDGVAMPAAMLDPAELAALVAYLDNLR